MVVCAGCTTPQLRRARTIGEVSLAGALFGVLGTSVAAVFDHRDRAILLDVGLACAPIALFGAGTYAVAQTRLDDAQREPSLRERAQTSAMDLAKQAKRAARAGDCVVVQTIEPRVRALDEGIYLRFLRDPVIRTCREPRPGAGDVDR